MNSISYKTSNYSMEIPSTPAEKFTSKDLATDQEVRWCPGCGDYSILIPSMEEPLLLQAD